MLRSGIKGLPIRLLTGTMLIREYKRGWHPPSPRRRASPLSSLRF